MLSELTESQQSVVDLHLASAGIVTTALKDNNVGIQHGGKMFVQSLVWEVPSRQLGCALAALRLVGRRKEVNVVLFCTNL